MRLTEKNYLHNHPLDLDPATSTENRLITDQNGKTGELFRYGAYPAKRNACEVIALHNAKVLLGRPSMLSETVRDFQDRHLMIGRGFFGSNPLRIGRILRYYGIPFQKLRKKDLTEPGLYILSYWNPRPLRNGLHTVALTFDGDRCTVYNLREKTVTDPRPLCRRMLCAYRLSEN